MPDATFRRDDLAVGRRGNRIAIGRAGVGTPPLFIDDDTARWLALVALPALTIAPPRSRHTTTPTSDPGEDAEAGTPIQEASAHLAPTRRSALF